MADKKLTDLGADASPSGDDYMLTTDSGSGTSKRTLISSLASAIASLLPSKSVAASQINFAGFSGKALAGTVRAISTSNTTFQTGGTQDITVSDSGILVLVITGTGSSDFKVAASLSGANTQTINPDFTLQGVGGNRASLVKVMTGLNPGVTTITTSGARLSGTGSVTVYGIVDAITI